MHTSLSVGSQIHVIVHTDCQLTPDVTYDFFSFLGNALPLFPNFLVILLQLAMTGFYESCFGGQETFPTLTMTKDGSSTISFPELVTAL